MGVRSSVIVTVASLAEPSISRRPGPFAAAEVGHVDDDALDEETVEGERQAVDHARARGDVAGERDDVGGGSW